MRSSLPLISGLLLAVLPLSTSAPLAQQSATATTSSSSSGATASSSPSSSSTYQLNTLYTSSNFFDAFTFFSAVDPTQGHVQYQDRVSAAQLSLAGRLPSVAQKPIYLGVDHTSLAPSGRASVRVQSTDSWMHGLFVFDIAHMPTGCGTWPAAWLVGAGAATWPADGEIDILEGVNDQIGNRMTLHTSAGCSIDNSTSSSTTTATSQGGGVAGMSAGSQGQTQFTGVLTTPDCNVNAPTQAKNAGCSVADNNPASFGTAFNAAGGGIYAVEWTSNGVAMWFFSHSNEGGSSLPADLSAALAQADQSNTTATTNTTTSTASSLVLDPSTWPTPVSRFAGSGCDFDSHIRNQSIVINTSLCGDWAGAPAVWNASPSCKSLAPTCEAFVTQNPAAFRDAWWAVNSVGVWQRD